VIGSTKVHVEAKEDPVMELSQQHEKRGPVIHSLCGAVDGAEDVPFAQYGVEVVFSGGNIVIPYVREAKGSWNATTEAVL